MGNPPKEPQENQTQLDTANGFGKWRDRQAAFSRGNFLVKLSFRTAASRLIRNPEGFIGNNLGIPGSLANPRAPE
ncbi:MAG: hypothetical protein ACJAVZ_001439 [Afipia broomeae]|jgi:hypothetical protein